MRVHYTFLAILALQSFCLTHAVPQNILQNLISHISSTNIRKIKDIVHTHPDSFSTQDIAQIQNAKHLIMNKSRWYNGWKSRSAEYRIALKPIVFCLSIPVGLTYLMNRLLAKRLNNIDRAALHFFHCVYASLATVVTGTFLYHSAAYKYHGYCSDRLDKICKFLDKKLAPENNRAIFY